MSIAIETDDSPPAHGDLLKELDAVFRDGSRLMDGLADDAMFWRPSEAGWSVGECVSHLLVTLELYLPRIESAVTAGLADPRARRDPGTPSRPPRGFAARLIQSQEPPVKRGMKAVKVLREFPDRDGSSLRNDWVTQHESLEAWIRDSATIDLTRVKIRSPVLRLLRMKLDTAIRFILAHERRHIWQGWNVRRDPRFPTQGS